MEKASVSFNGHECFKTSETIRFFFEKYDQLMIFIPPQISEGIRKKSPQLCTTSMFSVPYI